MAYSNANIEDQFKRLMTTRNILEKDKRKKQRQIRTIDRQIKEHKEAKAVILEVSRKIKEQLKERIETLITMALRAVYDRPLGFELAFEEKRGNIEVRPLIREGDYAFEPKDEIGGGAIDIISFALRIVLWSLRNDRSRNVFILDEPFRFTGQLVERAGVMLKQLSKQLGFQVIVISHEDELINICDRAYRVRHNGVESVVTLVKKQQIKRRKKR